MTKPTSYLAWAPDTADPHALRARWIGPGWHYTIRWGDGSSDRMLHWQGAKKHTYPAAGTWTIVCVSDVHDDWTISAEVTIRDLLRPEATFELAGGTTVQAHLGELPAPVRYAVGWGDGTGSVHGGEDLDPKHTYPGGGQPVIDVVDQPSRRAARFVGPVIPPPPPPEDLWWTWRLGVDQNSPLLRVEGLTPGGRWRAAVPWARVWTGVADPDGVADTAVGFPAPHKTPLWQWVTFIDVDGGRELHVPWWQPAPAGLVLVYDFDADDPQQITLRQLWQPQAGWHRIDWGDGQVELVDSDGRTWQATHRYANRDPLRIAVTAPDQAVATRKLAPLNITSIHRSPSGKWGQVYLDGAADQYTQVRVDWGDGRDRWQEAAWSATADPPGGPTQVSTPYPDHPAGGSFTVRATAALTEPRTAMLAISPHGRTERHPGGPDPDRNRRSIMSHPPALVSEGYVHPKTTVGLRIINLFEWADKARLTSMGFADDTPHELTIATDDQGRRYGRADVAIGDVEPGDLPATLHLPHGLSQQLTLIVEAPGDGTVPATWTKLDDKGMHTLRVEDLSRNAPYADAATPLSVGGAEGWFGLVKATNSPVGKASAVAADGLEPGKTYPVAVRLKFHGGHIETVRGQVTLPVPEPKDVGQLFVVRHEVNLAKAGAGDNIIHKVLFGSKKQTNTAYVVAWARKCVDSKGKPVKPTLEEATELALLEPYHFVRATDHVELHTRNPHKLRSNTRFSPIYLVTIFPVADDAGYSADGPAGDGT